ncbi:hypothetical protein B5807_11133 [Epicoccum nigrum]|jgi:cytochrome P450|uniref:Uncharacterized protein n=1 Tax=Epicoccum nigrum TaxID=105696 RepID=A0A1Y2LL24_EPING|nr:hypothetical protein B5807_11133 [Epicoccum nigrum]
MVPAPGAWNTFTAVDREYARFRRRILGHGFADHRIREFEPLILHHAKMFVKRLLSSPDPESVGGWSNIWNMTENCRHMAYDIMGEFGFGQTFGLQTSDKNHFIIDAIHVAVARAGVYVQYPALQKWGLDKIFYISAWKMRTKFFELMGRMVHERVSEGKHAKKDLFSFVIDVKDPETGRSLTETELAAESRFLLIAGADTTSTGMTGIFFYLASNPEVYKKLANEIRTTYDNPNDIRGGAKLKSCKYFYAVIDECLRMSPPVSSALWREVTSDTFEVDGIHVPKGMDVGCSLYAFHHNEKLFPDSYTFNPDRWLVSETNPAEQVAELRKYFNPFSLGTRVCSGMNFTLTELADSIATTVWYLDMDAPDKTAEGLGGGYVGAKYGRHRPQEFQLYDHITCGHDGPYLRFRVREGAETWATELMAMSETRVLE